MSDLPINNLSKMTRLPIFDVNIVDSNFLSYTQAKGHDSNIRVKFLGYSSDESFHSQNIKLTYDNFKREHDNRLEAYNFYNSPEGYDAVKSEKLLAELKALKTITSFQHENKDAFTEIAKLTDDQDDNKYISVRDFQKLCALDDDDISLSTTDIKALFQEDNTQKRQHLEDIIKHSFDIELDYEQELYVVPDKRGHFQQSLQQRLDNVLKNLQKHDTPEQIIDKIKQEFKNSDYIDGFDLKDFIEYDYSIKKYNHYQNLELKLSRKNTQYNNKQRKLTLSIRQLEEFSKLKPSDKDNEELDGKFQIIENNEYHKHHLEYFTEPIKLKIYNNKKLDG